MPSNPRHNLIKRLQTELPRGVPFGLSELAAVGVSAHQAAYYAAHGWLTRLGQGVYAFPNDPLQLHGAVKFLQQKVAGLHVGGKSALAIQGVRHNLAARETLVLWGDSRFALPKWFTARFPARYVSAKLFDWSMPANNPRGNNEGRKLNATTVFTPPGVTDGLRVSAVERAVLELLHDVGTDQSLEEARSIFDGLRNVRADVVGQLLGRCTSVKTIRLFLTWSRETELLDVDALIQRYRPNVGSDKRWMSRLPDGTLLALKPHG